MSQVTAAICPRCTEEVLNASARCRHCGLARRDFPNYSIEPPSFELGPSNGQFVFPPVADVASGPTDPAVAVAVPHDAPRGTVDGQPAPPRPNGHVNGPGSPVADAKPRGRQPGGSSIFGIGLELPDVERTPMPPTESAVESTAHRRGSATDRKDNAASGLTSGPSGGRSGKRVPSLAAQDQAAFKLGFNLSRAIREGNTDQICRLAELLGNLARLNHPWAIGLLTLGVEQIDVSNPGGSRARAALASAVPADGEETPTLASLIGELEEGRTPAVRSTAAAGIGRLGRVEGVKPLEKAVHEGLPISMAALKALGEIPGEEAALVLAEALQSDEAVERSQAVKSLQKNGHRNAVRWIRTLHNDPDPMVQRVARKAATDLTDRLVDDGGSEPADAADDSTPAANPEKTKPAREPKKARKPAKARVRRKRSAPSWMNLETLRSLSPGDLVAGLLAMPVLLGGLVLAALVAGGLWFSGDVLAAATSGRNSDIVVRGGVSDVSISGDGRRVAVGRTRNVLDVFDVEGGYVLDEKAPAAGACVLSADGTRAFSGNAAQGVVWDLAGKTSTAIDGFELIGMTADRTVAVIGTPRGKFQKLDLTTGEVSPLFETESRPRSTAVAVNPDATQVLVGCEDGSVRIWSEEGGLSRTVLQGPVNGVSTLAFSGDGQRVAVGGPLGTLLVYDKGVSQPALETVFSSPKAVRVLRFEGVDTLRAVAGDAFITMDLTSGEEASAVKLTGAETEFVGVSKDASRLVAANEDSDFVRVYDTGSGKVVSNIKLD